MAASRYVSFALIVLFLTATGCGKRRENNGSEAEAANKRSEIQPVNADIEISQAARAKIAKLTGQNQGTQIRIEFTPGGCTGFRTKLSIQLDDPGPHDAMQDCGGVFCVFPSDQHMIVQGALINWKEKEQGFEVTFPKRTKENEKKISLWISEESEKRSVKLDEDDRLNGKLGERISEYRKLAAADPESELAHFRLGQLLMRNGQHGEAVKSFERTIEIAPDFSKAYQLLGECLVKLDQKDRAVQVLTKGWSGADLRGEDSVRNAIANVLKSIDAPVPASKK